MSDNRMAPKILTAILLLVIIIILAGLYGALHNQISYTVSSEYFSEFKFKTFKIPEQIQNRFGASLVGISATWWMGIIIGLIVIPIGLIIPGWKNFFFTMLKVFGIITATALVTGLIGLIISFFTINAANPPSFWYPKNMDIEAVIKFGRAGQMHNCSYLGGGIGLITGIISIIIFKKKSYAANKE